VTGQVQQDRCWFQYGIDQIRRHPGHWLALIPAKLGFTFDHESFAIEYLHEARPSAWPEARRRRGRELLTMAHRALLSIASLGTVAFVTRGRGRRTQALLAIAALALVAFAVEADAPTFWPVALFCSVAPWAPVPGAPERRPAWLLAVSLLATTLATHAIFFGEDRYHVVVTPILCMLAAGALRPAGKPVRERSA
jgi:hypothetical protein